MNYFANLLNQHVGGGLRDLGNYTGISGISQLGNTIANGGTQTQGQSSLVNVPYGPPKPTPQLYSSQSLGDIQGPVQDPFEQALKAYAASSQAPAAAASPAPVVVPPTVFNGKNYDLNDAQQRVNYFNDVNAGNFSQANQQYDLTHNNITQSIGNLTRSKEQGLSDIERAMGDLNASKSNYFANSQRQGQDFNDQYGLGSVNRAQSFSALGPNAYQSSQGTSQDFAEKKYLQGLGDMQAADSQAAGQFGQQQSDLNRNKDNFGIDYNQTLQGLQQQDALAGQTRDNYISQNRDKVAQSLQGVDQSKGLTDFTGRYAVSPYDPSAIKTADLSAYTPYTNFQSLQASPTVASQGANLSIKPNSSLSPQANYFGYAPTKANQDYLTNYFKTGNINQ